MIFFSTTTSFYARWAYFYFPCIIICSIFMLITCVQVKMLQFLIDISTGYKNNKETTCFKCFRLGFWSLCVILHNMTLNQQTEEWLQMDPDPINYEQRSLYSCADIVVIIKKSLNDWLTGQKEIYLIIPTWSCAETHFYSQITVGDFWQQYLARGSWDVHRYSVYSCRS